MPLLLSGLDDQPFTRAPPRHCRRFPKNAAPAVIDHTGLMRYVRAAAPLVAVAFGLVMFVVAAGTQALAAPEV